MFFSRVDFREFVVGFLLTTKGTMEEKLDDTFQLDFEFDRRFSDIDKDGYIDQSGIDVMAKLKPLFVALPLAEVFLSFLLSVSVRLKDAGWRRQ